ncbi:MAG: ATP-binding protein [Armatimonadota bacterium]|nr:ATP-binding protein [Armatimonadota bacterium]MDR7454293.1 ATP-binding protein [Armatimonadota bacterium]MDR7495421.1 ATP-binding protein [Armatimonadota bacterium]MDR7510848.1 ATP-binding protein [Armatimonadota bacterium]
MFRRHLTTPLLAALGDTPVVLLHGARQVGKSTLAQEITSAQHPARYLTLDDATVLAAARSDPAGFISGLKGPAVIDEVQRVPELFLPIKAAVDRDRRPGRFLLTGSANVLLLPKLSESLAGRMEVLRLWPLSQGEIAGAVEEFIDRVFARALVLPSATTLDRDELAGRIAAGGYPEAVRRSTARRPAWFRAYVTTILQRTVRDIVDIERLHEIPRLLSVLAARTGTLLNVADLSRTLGIPQTTLQRYLALLQATFLVHLLPAWTAKVRKRLLRSPKILVVDTGLAGHLAGVDSRALPTHPELWGPFVETFLAMELMKQAGWSTTQPTLYHLRTAKGEDVDVVLEAPSGEIVGVEVKAAVSVDADDFRGLRILAEIAGRRFLRGTLLYLGSQAVPFGANLYALPISSVWHWQQPGPAGRGRAAAPGARSSATTRRAGR